MADSGWNGWAQHRSTNPVVMGSRTHEVIYQLDNFTIDIRQEDGMHGLDRMDIIEVMSTLAYNVALISLRTYKIPYESPRGAPVSTVKFITLPIWDVAFAYRWKDNVSTAGKLAPINSGESGVCKWVGTIEDFQKGRYGDAISQ